MRPGRSASAEWPQETATIVASVRIAFMGESLSVVRAGEAMQD